MLKYSTAQAWFRRQTPTVAMMTVIRRVSANPAARRVPILSLMKLPMVALRKVWECGVAQHRKQCSADGLDRCCNLLKG